MDLHIRLEKLEDYSAVVNLTREAFWNVYKQGCDEHYLVHIMRDDDSFIPALDFVAEADGQIVGNIMYTKAYVEDEAEKRYDVILIGPLSVLPAYQGKGIGTALIRHSAQEAKRLGYRAMFLYGDPLYYSRVGFEPGEKYGIVTPDGKPHPALQVLPLFEGAMEGISGKLHDAEIYQVDPKNAEAFDAVFPPKEKKVTESQKRFQALSGGGE